MLTKGPYRPLDAATIVSRLGAMPELVARIGPPDRWRVGEIGDGNLNLVFTVEGPTGSVIAKQALPYARCVGEAWPMSLDRAFFEYNALVRLGQRDPGSLPEVYACDEAQALVIMEYLSPHVILRKALIAGEHLPHLAGRTGRYLARTLFRGSDFAMETARRKADLALFAANVELCGITEDLVFTDPFTTSPRNRCTPGLEPDAAAIRADRALKRAATGLKTRFATGAETLLHGDFHTGSVMVTADDTRVIDPEFAFYGPMGFDVGSFIGNLVLAHFAQAGHGGDTSERTGYAAWILEAAEEVWQDFSTEFAALWKTERTGILGGRELFQNDEAGADLVLNDVLAAVWRDTVGFAGIEMLRRVLGLAHAAEIESIGDERLRADCERRALAVGRLMMTDPGSFRPSNLRNRVVSVGRF